MVQIVPLPQEKELATNPDAIATDGSEVRILLGLKAGSMAHFRLKGGEISRAVTHRTVEEIWFFLCGRGEMWRCKDRQGRIREVYRGVCLTIPVGTHFQLRCTSDAPLEAIGVTMPPWPGDREARLVEGVWQPTVPRQPDGQLKPS